MRSMLRNTIAGLMIAAMLIVALPHFLLAQDTGGGSSTGTVLLTMVSAALTVVIPWLTTYIYEGVQHVITFLKGLPPIVQRLLVVVIPIPLNIGLGALGLPSVTGLEGITPDIIIGVLQGLAAIGLHHKQMAAITQA